MFEMGSSQFPSASGWRWQWEDLCGADGFKIWSPKTHDLGLCFEQLCLEIPVLTLLAAVSAFYFGRQIDYVVRGKVQLMAINIRCIIIGFLVMLPLIHIYIGINKSETSIDKIAYFLSAVEGIAWLTHLGYTLVLRKRLGLSPRGPVFMCVLWSLLAVLSVISFRSHLLIYQSQKPTNFSILLAYSFSIVRFILQILYGLTLLPSDGETVYVAYTQSDENQPLLANNPYIRFNEELDPNYLGVAMDNNSCISKLLFYWVNPLMKKGVEGQLNHPDDLHDLPDDLNCTCLRVKLDKALIGNVDIIQRKTVERLHENVSASSSITPYNVTMKGTKHQVSLFMALHKCFWVQFYGIGILRFIADAMAFAGPILLNKLVSFIENKSEDISLGYMYAAGLFVSTLIGAFCDTHFNFLMSIIGLKIKAAMITTIYSKTLNVCGTVLNSAFSVGEIINFMSTDTDRIVNACPSFHAFWSIPFQITVSLYLIYHQVGFAFVAGLVFSIALIPINKVIANKIGKLSTKMMEQKDGRVKMMTEVLRGIRSIKIYVWEQHFIKLISKMREGELKYLKSRKYLDALCVYFWATTPILISILTFVSYVVMGNKLSAATVFTTMALINMLIGPLNAFPWVLNGITEAWVSIKRIQKLLDLSDLNLDSYYNNDVIIDSTDYSLIFKDASFSWGKSLDSDQIAKLHSVTQRKTKNKGIGKNSMLNTDVEDNTINNSRIFRIQNINIIIKQGEFFGIIGTVGSGKSSILQAIQAEVFKESGIIAISNLEKGFGLVTQQPWLQRGTIRDNILFGKTYDHAKYTSVLYACCLNEDLLLLPANDFTGVGEGGITLSGGQKARVALARAVYQDKSIYLLDDILSAVDSKVARHIFKHCIMGLLKNKTRILCTHHIKFLLHTDCIIVMENGVIKQQGKPTEVLSNIDEFLPIDIELEDGISSDQSSVNIESIDNPPPDTDSILEDEGRETGTIKLSVYSRYWRAIGHLLSFSIIIALSLMQTSRNMTDWWLSYWVSNEGSSNRTNVTLNRDMSSRIVLSSILQLGDLDSNTKKYLIIYIVFAALNSLFTLFRAFLFAYGGILAANKIHKLLLKSIIWSKVTFFDISPIGRIINRFSSDTYTVDDSLPFILNILLSQLFGLLGSAILTVYGLPWLCLILVPLIPVYHWLQYYYRLTSRELKRLSSTTLSPVYNHFNETLQGLSTIRAFRASTRFKRDNEDNVETTIKAQFASQAAARWLGLRLQFIGVIVVTGVGFIAVIQHQFDIANPGLIGLAISYALSITGLLSGVVNAFTETEREMIAVERVTQYIDEIEPESTAFILDPPYAWPCQGVVKFDNVSLKYRDHLGLTLKAISFETRPAEKIGIVGRTGAGKSSLLVALYRLVEISSGNISIDSVNIAHMSLSALRSRLSCIPQDPFLFFGTIKENLDPLSEYRDQEIWSALTKVNLTATVKRLGGLDFVFKSGGANLSAGQRQLFCLARAVLHNTKILCIDEATANVDQETERLIQQTLQSSFRKSTVLTIAHRIQTVLECDRVLVMRDGHIIEYDNPNSLLEDCNSHFYKMVNED